MKMIKIPLQLTIFVLLGSSFAVADTVYKSVDENGVISFSDTPPEDGGEAETLQLVAPQPSSSGESLANLEAMRETTDRMAADRREREKHRAELRETQARTKANQRSQTASNSDYIDDFYPITTGYDNRRYYQYRPPYRPGLHPKPVHPIARPPIRARSGGAGSSNSQLMRPITSTRR